MKPKKLFDRFREPGPWFWILIAAGAMARLFLVIFTEGTYDVAIWKGHAEAVLARGLVGAYTDNPELNHPPLACMAIAGLLSLSTKLGIPFRVLLRAPIAIADLGTAFVLFRVLRESPYRWLVTGLYAVHPVAVIFSGYHGNTDPLIALFVLGGLLSASAGRPFWTGLVLGVSFWIKLPGLLALPALALSFPRWRDRAVCVMTAAGAGVLTYLPILASAPGLLYSRVFAYEGQMLHTTAGVTVWGPRTLLRLLWDVAGPARPLVETATLGWMGHNTAVILIPLLMLAWLRREERTVIGIGATLAGCYAIAYGVSFRWAFQYLAWSVPFWFLAGPIFCTGATVLSGSYIYALYAYLCGDLLLRGTWDFAGHPRWPRSLTLLRDTAVAFFAVAGSVFLVNGIRAGRKRMRSPRQSRSVGSRDG